MNWDITKPRLKNALKCPSVREEVLRLFSFWVLFPPRDGKASALRYWLSDAPEKQGIILVRVHSQFCGHGVLLCCCRVSSDHKVMKQAQLWLGVDVATLKLP
jgi:hypothetical protein